MYITIFQIKTTHINSDTTKAEEKSIYTDATKLQNQFLEQCQMVNLLCPKL